MSETKRTRRTRTLEEQRIELEIRGLRLQKRETKTECKALIEAETARIMESYKRRAAAIDAKIAELSGGVVEADSPADMPADGANAGDTE